MRQEDLIYVMSENKCVEAKSYVCPVIILTWIWLFKTKYTKIKVCLNKWTLWGDIILENI